MKRFFIYLIFLFCATNIIAQTYNMPIYGHSEATTSNCTLYDNGGASGNHATRSNASFTINATNSNKILIITGSRDLENCNKTRLTIYNGDTNSNVVLFDGCESGAINTYSHSSKITVKFTADTDTPRSGFMLNIIECDCPAPYNVVDSVLSPNSFMINWQGGDASTNWIVEYTNDTSGMSNPIIINTDTNYVNITGLIGDTNYSYCIRADCAPLYSYCQQEYCDIIKTPCPCEIPNNIQVTIHHDTLFVNWTENNPNSVWVISLINGDNINKTDTINITHHFFTGVDTTLDYTLHIYNDCNNGRICNDRYVYYRHNNNNNNDGCNCPVARNLIVTETHGYTANLNWDYDPNQIGWVIKYVPVNYPEDSCIYDTMFTNSYVFNNLIPVTDYICYVYPLCDTFSYDCFKLVAFFSNIVGDNNCLDFTNLKGSNCLAMTGNYNNPNIYYGLIDHGCEDSTSRHTTYYMRNETDPRTNNQLLTIPPGEMASVRLGNWIAGSQAESLTYKYIVDTNNYDIMMLKYAIVLEDPNHTRLNQPRFTLEILDSNKHLMDTVCGFADFYASGDLGWNSVLGTSTIWKDWTTIGLDISPYHNQTIFIRLTTYDCAEGGHFGYAYYNLKCGNKYSSRKTCGYADTLGFQAPLGFRYLWYNEDYPLDTLSTNREIEVPLNSNIYSCRCSFLDNSSCSFVVSFISERNFPFALFDYEIEQCNYKVHFYNHSIISNNDSLPVGHELCNEVRWIFHDGTQSNLINPVFNYDSSGVYPVILIASMNSGECVDTIIGNVVIDDSLFTKINISGNTTICQGDTVSLMANELNNYNWSTGDTTQSILISPFETSKYYLTTRLKYNCNLVDSITIRVNKKYNNDTVEYGLCKGDTINFLGFHITREGIYSRIENSIYGCDSIINLRVFNKPVIDNYSLIENKYVVAEDFPIIVDVSCENCYNYMWNTGSRDSIYNITHIGNYYVTIGHRCGDIYDSIVVVYPEVLVLLPNAFTPNENKNNTFFPVFETKEKVFIESFEIYNRWGAIIYSSKNNGWDGKYNGKLCDSGVYVWRLLYKTKYTGNNIFEKTGDVNLIR